MSKIFVVVVETKGAHLVDSYDTKRKKAFFRALNQTSKKNINFLIGTFSECQSEIIKIMDKK